MDASPQCYRRVLTRRGWLRGALLLLPLALIPCGGCHLLNVPLGEPSTLPPMPKARDSVLLEITFVRLMNDEAEALEDVWRLADEQPFAAETRRAWSANGMRVGLLGKQYPDLLRERIQKPLEPAAGDDTTVGTQTAASQIRRELHCRGGQKCEIVASTKRDAMVVLMKENGQARGETYQQAQCRFTARAMPQDDGRVRLELLPEIHHGEHKQRYVGGDGMFRLEVGQQAKVFRELLLSANLAPGQTLMLSGTAETMGLGRHFFTEGEGSQLQRKLLLVRLAESPANDLFAPETKAEPLATTWE